MADMRDLWPLCLRVGHLHRFHPTCGMRVARALLNWFGCVFGGCRADLMDRAFAVARSAIGAARGTVLGRGQRVDIANAAFLNCYSSSLNRLRRYASGQHRASDRAGGGNSAGDRGASTGFGCKLPQRGAARDRNRMPHGLRADGAAGDCSVAWTMTGLVGGIGAAAAVGKLLGLSEDQIDIGARHRQRTRPVDSARTSHHDRDFPMAQSARSGLIAALLAAEGFAASETALDGPKGFAHVFAPRPTAAGDARSGTNVLS